MFIGFKLQPNNLMLSCYQDVNQSPRNLQCRVSKRNHKQPLGSAYNPFITPLTPFLITEILLKTLETVDGPDGAEMKSTEEQSNQRCVALR